MPSRTHHPSVPLTIRGCEPSQLCPQASGCIRAHVAHHDGRLVDDHTMPNPRPSGCNAFLDRRGLTLVRDLAWKGLT